jgi:hypothetical protein
MADPAARDVEAKLKALPWLRALPAAVVCLLFAVFSFSPVVTFHGGLVANLQGLDAPFGKLVDPFRSSGRFIWPLHYLLVTVPLLALVRPWAQRRWASAGVLGLALALKLADLTFAPVASRWKPTWLHRLSSEGWSKADGHYQHLKLVPRKSGACATGWSATATRWW